MNQSKMRSVTVPDVNQNVGAGGPVDGAGTPGSPRPTTAAQASTTWQRVVVRNVSFGVTVWLSHESSGLQINPVGGDTFELPAGCVDTFVLAPGQKLFAIAGGTGAKISIATSDALPLDIPGK